MNEKVKEKLELFVENRNIINTATKIGHESIIVAEALVFTNANRKADVERIKECREIIKKKTSALSGFRGTIEPIISAKMSLQADPEKYFDEVLRIYPMLNKSKIDSYEAIIAVMNVVDKQHNEHLRICNYCGRDHLPDDHDVVRKHDFLILAPSGTAKDVFSRSRFLFGSMFRPHSRNYSKEKHRNFNTSGAFFICKTKVYNFLRSFYCNENLLRMSNKLLCFRRFDIDSDFAGFDSFL